MANNIILKTIKEVEFFNTRVYLEIFENEKHAYLILSEQKPFDIDSLKEYLIENDLNQFAKNEIKNLLIAIDYFLKLHNKHRELPISKKFYHYKNENSWGKVEASGWGNLFYILHRNDKFMKINEMRFKENHTAELIYTFLVASRISKILNEIKDLFVDFIESENIINEVPQQTEAVKNDKLLKNPHELIFSSDFAYTLFDKMKEYYNDSNTKQADYSNLCDIMQKEEFVICSGVDFITLLSKYDINLTKIDSSKIANKRKTKLYNSIKDNLQQKHGLSTV